MCTVFVPHARCPHIRETCRNRALHPRMDVLYLKNAEVDSFNGCGYCKWARTDPPPPPKQSGYNNPGWPGCCRPPSPSEYKFIPAADWRSVSIIHHVSIPPDIRVVLDGLSNRGSPLPSASPNPGRSNGIGKPSFDRKNSGTSSPSTKSGHLAAKSLTMSSPGRRAGGSPQPPTNFLSANLSRTSSGTAISASVPNSSAINQHLNQLRPPTADLSDRVQGTQSSRSSPSRKHIDLENQVTPRRMSSMRRPTVSPATTSVSVSAIIADNRNQGSVRRRASLSNSNSPVTPPSRNADHPISFVVPRSSKKGDDSSSSASSSSGSSDGNGSMSDCTVTSDGGFTDYLSDESEAELQRQAEARAALVAQNQAEELEFKAARQQLAHVDLRPPKSWNATNIMNNNSGRIPADRKSVV